MNDVSTSFAETPVPIEMIASEMAINKTFQEEGNDTTKASIPTETITLQTPITKPIQAEDSDTIETSILTEDIDSEITASKIINAENYAFVDGDNRYGNSLETIGYPHRKLE